MMPTSSCNNIRLKTPHVPTGVLVMHPMDRTSEQDYDSPKEVILALRRTVAEHAENFCNSGQIHTMDDSAYTSEGELYNLDIALARALGKTPNPTYIDDLSSFITISQRIYHMHVNKTPTIDSEEHKLQRWGEDRAHGDFSSAARLRKFKADLAWHETQTRILSELLTELKEKINSDAKWYAEFARQNIDGPLPEGPGTKKPREAYSFFDYAFYNAAMNLDAEWEEFNGVSITVQAAEDGDDEYSASDFSDLEF